METIDINQALPHISKLLERASAGEEIVITKNNRPMVKLVSPQTLSTRPPLFGCDRDLIAMSDDFDEPLEDFQDYQ
ncbi:MAG: type II toxin-antitoxin system Phd/YefM family antitoxin [Chloroflexaceae bacterium]|nr:type II toxin-antitoxin system Phd/YefM family antitoxin [Chloroflexaceae bacterium]